jgi:DNA repair protein RadC
MDQYSLFTDVDPTRMGALLLRDSAGEIRPATRKEILRVARELVTINELCGKDLSSPTKTKDFLRLRLASLEHEVCGLLLLDSRNRLITYLEPFRGTLTQASIYPREIVKLVIQHNAASVMLVHNHPARSPEPSMADRQVTRIIKQALALIDVQLLDHFIVAGSKIVSMSELGQI